MCAHQLSVSMLDDADEQGLRDLLGPERVLRRRELPEPDQPVLRRRRPDSGRLTTSIRSPRSTTTTRPRSSTSRASAARSSTRSVPGERLRRRQRSSASPTQQIQTEIQNVLTAKGWQPSTTTLFFVMTPNGVGSCFDSVANQCSTNTFCAYHSDFIDSNSVPVIYANEPYDGTTSGCTPSQGFPNDGDADADDQHDQPRAQRGDHRSRRATPGSPPTAARTVTSAPGFGTHTRGVGVDAYNQVINGHHYGLQQEYSNDGSSVPPAATRRRVGAEQRRLAGAERGRRTGTASSHERRARDARAERIRVHVAALFSERHRLLGHLRGHGGGVPLDGVRRRAHGPRRGQCAQRRGDVRRPRHDGGDFGRRPAAEPDAAPVFRQSLPSAGRSDDQRHLELDRHRHVRVAPLRCRRRRLRDIPAATSATYVESLRTPGRRSRSSRRHERSLDGGDHLEPQRCRPPRAGQPQGAAHLGPCAGGKEADGQPRRVDVAPTAYGFQWLRCNAHGARPASASTTRRTRSTG